MQSSGRFLWATQYKSKTDHSVQIKAQQINTVSNLQPKLPSNFPVNWKMLGKAHISLLLEETKFYDCKKIETENKDGLAPTINILQCS